MSRQYDLAWGDLGDLSGIQKSGDPTRVVTAILDDQRTTGMSNSVMTDLDCVMIQFIIVMICV